ncbi:thrombospondin type-1 domain-containing protein 7A-like [Notothenia coriiceps]|uniref:Thrombospondin type-1 domain-containing protein 7A-like n=1 Tax=Notothenia coriiceps TaxID=8208 RepID=A0A6I9Q724_9TELE|nr:PREDICTED: thrombospondin type-1 domain-containing protein 7A-like [Notothenia coriiceps]
MVIDFRRVRTSPLPLCILGEDVAVMEDYKYLGMHLDNGLNWRINTDTVHKKGMSRLFSEEAEILPRVQQDAGDLLPRSFGDSVDHQTPGRIPGKAVSCRQLDGTQADINECLKFAKAMPSITQHCQLPCQDDCQLTNWSKFSSCTADCVGVRTRKRALIGRSKKKDKCKNTQMYPLSETQYCPCDKYNAQPVGNWSDCILPEGGRVESLLGMKVQGDIKECGQGYRYQAMVCYDQDNRLVETLRCNSHGYIEEACIIPCPSDCKLSEWSNWSRCSKSCGSGVKVRSKWLREKPYNGGRPCPKLDHINQAQVYEVVPCQSDCNQYVWVAEPWSVWKVSNVDLKENCGEGVQTRKVRCMLNTIDGPSESVEDYLCDPEEMPLGARESRLPCPEDCVLNDWGSWSRCSLPCTRTNSRVRMAYTLRSPSVGRECPDTSDNEPCSLNLNCFNYFYNITGTGHLASISCCTVIWVYIDLFLWCPDSPRPTTVRPCQLPCKKDCIMTPFSNWTLCPFTCDTDGNAVKTKQTRKRLIIQQPSNGGQDCPEVLEEENDCEVPKICPGFRWKSHKWRKCQLVPWFLRQERPGAQETCGPGLQTRALNWRTIPKPGRTHGDVG